MPATGAGYLDDAVVLAATMADPLVQSRLMAGSDRRRIRALHDVLAAPTHRSWLALDPQASVHGRQVLQILSANPQQLPPPRPLLGGS